MHCTARQLQWLVTNLQSSYPAIATCPLVKLPTSRTLQWSFCRERNIWIKITITMEWLVGSVGNNPSAHTIATGIKWFGKPDYTRPPLAAPPPPPSLSPSHYWVETSEVWALSGFSSCNFGQNYEIWERCNILAKSKFTNICKIWNCRWVLPFVKLPKYFQSLHLSNAAENLKNSSSIKFKILAVENSFSLTLAKNVTFSLRLRVPWYF